MDATQYFNHVRELDPIFTAHYIRRAFDTGISFGKAPAMELFDRALELNPEDAEIYHYRGLLHHIYYQRDEGGDNALRAIEDYTTVLRYNPYRMDVLFGRGVLLQQLRVYSAAVADFSRVVTLQPCFALAYARRAEVFLAMGGRESRAYADLKYYSQLVGAEEMLPRYRRLLETVGEEVDSVW